MVQALEPMHNYSTFGKMKGDTIDPLMLDNKPLDFVPQWSYLGTTIISGNDITFSTRSEFSKSYRSYNSLLSVVQKPNTLVLMNLLYSYCIPSLTYAAEVKDILNREMQTLNVALTNAIRRIFSHNRWESTRCLLQQLGYPISQRFSIVGEDVLLPIVNRGKTV